MQNYFLWDIIIGRQKWKIIIVGEDMYQALYRKYRPKNFDEVLGQDHITRVLKNQISMGNIAHAYLFSGTRGTGKTSTAKIFSRAVNCLNPQDGNPCNQCHVCRGIMDESIMDVVEMDAASNRGIEDIRDLREKVKYPPTSGKYKVYIIDEVHMLTAPAFNALLKTLEEPPKHLIFILATTEPEKLPQTILSRCQRFDFKRVSTKDIRENMKNICKDLGIEVEDRVLNLIARNTDGAMRDALSLLDQCLSFSSGKITYDEAISILGMVDGSRIMELIKAIIGKDIEKSLEYMNEIIEDGKDIHQFIKDIISHFRNMMIVKTSKNPENLLDLEEGLLSQYEDLVRDIDISFILSSLDILNISDEKAKWSSTPRIILEMALIQISKLEERLSLEERIKRLEEGYRPTKASPEKPKVSQEKPKVSLEKKVEVLEEKILEEESFVESSEDLGLEKIKGDWDQILQSIKAVKMNIFALIREGFIIGYDNKLLTIGYNEGYGFHKEAISNPQNKEFVENIVSKYFSKRISINFVMANEKTIEKEEDQDIDQAIQEVVDFFGEDIVEINE